MKRLILPLLTVSCLPLMTACPGNDTSGQEEVGESSTGETTDDPTAESGTTVDPTTETTDDPTTETTDDPTTETTDPTTETGTTDDPTTETGTTDDPTTETGGGVCGDAIIDVGEECEGADLGGLDCVGLGFAGGELACTAECLFDTAGCFQSECGNGVLEPGEDCDGADFGAATCADFGFGAGELSCLDDCTIVADACTNCGNDLIDDPEICDGADLGGQDCVALGYDGGELSCAADCSGFVEDACTQSQVFSTCVQPNTAIPALGIGTASVINVPDMGTVLDVDVSILGTHTWVSDVDWTLTKGNTNALVIAIASSCSGDNWDVDLDDESAGGAVELQCVAQPPAIAGSRTPTNPLSVFDGGAVSGDWSMQPNDTVSGDAGTFQEWCITITYE
jgi:hypothetical protein